jgi:hypothetical protein
MHHYISLKVGVGHGTNNYSELLALKLVLMLAQEYGVKKIQISRNLLLVM